MHRKQAPLRSVQSILVVGHNSPILESVTAVLNGRGYRARIAVDPVRASHPLGELPPNLIVADLDNGGVELVQSILSTGDSWVPLIGLTGGSDSIIGLETVALVTKPFGYRRFLAVIEEWLAS